MVQIGYWNFVYHLDNAEMIQELSHDLINFSFDSFQDVLKEFKERDKDWPGNVHIFTTLFLNCLKGLVRYHFYSCVLHTLIK